jgi:AcrR family transcriptional regulator
VDYSEPRPAGRPRDAAADDRIIDAALAEYAAHGRAGYSLNGVARRAGVGKSSIYLRWPDKESLLVDAVHLRSEVPDVDTGSLRGDLHALVDWLLGCYLTEAGWVVVRITVDSAADGESTTSPQVVGAHHAEAVNDLWRRAAARGEIGPEDDRAVHEVTRMMFGDLIMRAMVDRERMLGLSAEARSAEAAYVVDLLLRLLGR